MHILSMRKAIASSGRNKLPRRACSMACRSNVADGMSSRCWANCAAKGDAFAMRTFAWFIALRSVSRVASGALEFIGSPSPKFSRFTM